MLLEASMAVEYLRGSRINLFRQFNQPTAATCSLRTTSPLRRENEVTSAPAASEIFD